MRLTGLISEQLAAQPVEVNYTWYDKLKGIIQWNFKNTGSTTRSFILLRGIEENNKVSEVYAFGNAFYPLYYKNFHIYFATKPEPLVNISVKTNSAPLAIMKNSNSTLLVAFLYTLSAGSNFSVLEGGWSGIQPGGIKIVDAEFSGTGNFEIKYDEKQCTLYNEESDTDYPCPANPFTVRSAIMNIDSNIKPLFNDKISRVQGENCRKEIQKYMESNNLNDYYEALQCLLEQYI